MKLRYAVLLVSGLSMMTASAALADDAPATGMTHKAKKSKSTASTSPKTRQESPTGADSKSMTGTTEGKVSDPSASTDATKRQESPTGEDSKSMIESDKAGERPSASASTDPTKRQESPTGEDSKSMTQFGKDEAEGQGQGSDAAKSDAAEAKPDTGSTDATEKP